MNAAVVKKTQDTLGRVIKKPPLTEKLLNKPPFRYLHDIFSEIIRTTGFMKGLYEEGEMKSDNVKDKDMKMAFLQKAIDVVMLVTGEPLAAKPARIVAGHEPEKTNELLQAIAKCCLNKISSEEAVKRVLAGDKGDMKTKASTSRSQDKENREGHEHHVDREEKKRTIERSGSREQPKEHESRRRDRDKDHRQDRERSDKHRRGEQDRAKDDDKDKSRDRERDKEKDKGRGQVRDREKERERDREREKEKKTDREKTRDRDSNRDRQREKEKRRDKEREKEQEQHKDKAERNRVMEGGDRKVRVSEEPQQEHKPEDLNKTAKPVPAPAEAVENQPDSPLRIPRPSSAKGQRRRPRIGGQDESDSEGDGDLAQRPVSQENGDTAGSSAASDVASSNRRTSRPSSARPAPPRVKKQESYTDGTSTERLSSAKPSTTVIMDGKKLSEDEEDEDEQFLVGEAVSLPADAPEKELEPTPELNSDENHGGLVKKILETKKGYESSPSFPKSKDQNVVSETAWKKERDLVTREIDRLRSSIQMVCRSTLPLGKIMDYIQEDMDAMKAELQTWRRENKEHAQALLQEQRVTDQEVEPLKVELAKLEQLIKEQQDKICAVRSNILKNEEKIQKMVTGISFSSRT